MFPSFQGGQGDANATELDDRSEMPFHRYDNDGGDDSDRNRPGQAFEDQPAPLRSGPGSPSRGTTLSQSLPDLGVFNGYLAGGVDRVVSFAADATLGAQVARVSFGLDAKVRKACEAQIFEKFGLENITTSFASMTTGSARETPAAIAPQLMQGDVSQAEHENVCHKIQLSQNASKHLEAVLGALEDYQKHRQGLADAEQRLALALQEAGQREQGPYGEALAACGKAHQQAAAKRLEAHAAEELHVVSKLRAHHSKAGADVKHTGRKYEEAWKELQRLRRARTDATSAKQRHSGDTVLTPTVEGKASQSEEVKVQLLRSVADAVKGKLSMFEAKHATDYGASMGAHMGCLAAEQSQVSTIYAGTQAAAETVKAGKTACAAAGLAT